MPHTGDLPDSVQTDAYPAYLNDDRRQIPAMEQRYQQQYRPCKVKDMVSNMPAMQPPLCDKKIGEQDTHHPRRADDIKDTIQVHAGLLAASCGNV